LGRIPEVSRPTLGTPLPTPTGFTLILDAGANADCKPNFLVDFAILGSIYLERIYDIPNPRIGLMSIGHEKSKGNILTIETHKLLSETKLNFIGNVEGSGILMGEADIIIADGFVGNIVLKFGESVIPLLKKKFYQYSKKGIFSKIWIGMIAGTIKKILSDFDYQKFGGVPLLGVDGNVIVGHGKSSPIAIKNMIIRAEELARKELTQEIKNKFSEFKEK
jgi:glycerol-3-phosphate acyltransferase PlsX